MDLSSLNLPFAGQKNWDRIDRHLDVRPNRRPRHADSYFHASEIRSLCPIKEYWHRAWLLALKKARGKKRKALLEKVHACANAGRPKASLQAIFDTGTVIHKQVQYYYGVTGLLVGAWRCPVCGFVLRGKEPLQMPRVAVASATGYKIHDFDLCPECHVNNETWPHWEYVEPFGVDKLENVAGSTDGFLDILFDGRCYNGILEVKSINANGFDEKYGDPLPKPEHVFQASIYMHLFGRSWALIVYFNKNTSQVKEFLVPKDPAAWDTAVGRSRAVTQGLKRGTPPSEDWRTCQRIKDPAARVCPAAFECWGEHPPENFMAA